MEKKHKRPRPQPTRPPDKDTAPPGASFNTDEGRAAHGMRKDLGGDPAKAPEENQHSDQEEQPPRDND